MAWVKSIYDQLKNSSEGHYSNFVNFEVAHPLLQALCLLLCACITPHSIVAWPCHVLCCLVMHEDHVTDSWQALDLQAPEDTEMSFSPEAWVKVQAAKATYDPHHLLRELDFYHDDGGHGPLDAALEPVSV